MQRVRHVFFKAEGFEYYQALMLHKCLHYLYLTLYSVVCLENYVFPFFFSFETLVLGHTKILYCHQMFLNQEISWGKNRSKIEVNYRFSKQFDITSAAGMLLLFDKLYTLSISQMTVTKVIMYFHIYFCLDNSVRQQKCRVYLHVIKILIIWTSKKNHQQR